MNINDGYFSPTSPLASPCSNTMSMSASTLTFSSQTSNASEMYENTSTKNLKGKRRSWHLMPNKVSIESFFNSKAKEERMTIKNGIKSKMKSTLHDVAICFPTQHFFRLILHNLKRMLVVPLFSVT
jgi:hypothetical protein